MLGRIIREDQKRPLEDPQRTFGGVIDLFTGQHRVNKSFLAKLEEQLLRVDTGPTQTAIIVERVKKAFLDKEVGDDVKAFVRKELRGMLADASEPIHYAAGGPTVVMIAGVNGSGRPRPSPSSPRNSRTTARRCCWRRATRSAPRRWSN